MDTSTLETEDLARLALGGRGRRNTRMRRALVARLLNEQSDTAEDGDLGETTEGDDEERQIARLLTGSRLLRKRRLRRLVLAHLLSERNGEEGEPDEEETDVGEEEGGSDRELARLLIGSRMLRRRRVRRALLAHLIKESAGTGEDIEEGDGDFADDEGDSEGSFIRLVIGSRLLRRRRVRRALLAHLMKERSNGDEATEEDEGEDTDLERQLARLLVGRRVVRHRRMRRALATRLREEAID